MKKSDTLFFTTIFPASEKYFDDFFCSLQRQSNKNFDILVVNDGYMYFENFRKKFQDLNITELVYSQSASMNRQHGINHAIELGYDFLIFGDSDDYFENNRVDTCIKKLKTTPIVVNDLIIFNDHGVIKEHYIANRISDNSIVDIDFIKEKNIFGLSNSAVRTEILRNIKFENDLIAADWHFFSILLLLNNKALFTKETATYYRQHQNNTVGIGSLTSESLFKGMKTKLKHYSHLKNEFPVFERLYQDILLLQDLARDSSYVEKMKTRRLPNPLWWEEIKLID